MQIVRRQYVDYNDNIEVIMSDKKTPWAFLDEYRAALQEKTEKTGETKPQGIIFSGEWPTLPEMFRIIESRFPEAFCFTIFEPDRITLNYKESLAIIQAVARWLHKAGIKKGDKVAVTGKNSPEWAVAYMGILFAGATVVPIDYHIRNEETDLLVKTARARILFVDEEKHVYYSENPGKLEAIVSLKKDV